MGPRTHHIKRGDTLYSISQKYGLPLSNLVEANPFIEHLDCIQVGHSLVLPRKDKKYGSSMASMSLSVASANRIRVPSPTRTVRQTNQSVNKKNLPPPIAKYFSQDNSTDEIKTSEVKDTSESRQPWWHLSHLTRVILQGRKRRTYSVQPGETLHGISKKFNTTTDNLKSLNKIIDEKIFIGSELTLPSSDKMFPRRSRVLNKSIAAKSGDTLSNLARKHNISIRQIKLLNPTLKTAKLRVGEEVVLRKGPNSHHRPLRQNKFDCPVEDSVVSSKFGWRWGSFHQGIDFAADYGTPILAPSNGKVYYAAWNGGYGNLLCVSHGSGFTTRYGHCDTIDIGVGQKVRKGQQIATVGSSGHSTGPHLHFEVRIKGHARDPVDFLKSNRKFQKHMHEFA